MTSEYPPGATVVCVRMRDAVYFADDIYCDCTRCGSRVRVRPYVPDHTVKVCLQCFQQAVKEARATGESLTVTVPEKASQEAALYQAAGGSKQ